MWQPKWSVVQGSSAIVWRRYYTPIFTGLICLTVPSTNIVWLSTDARKVLSNSIWQYTGHQSQNCIMTASFFVCQPSTNSCITSADHIPRWSGVHSHWPWDETHWINVYGLMFVRTHGTHCINVYIILPTAHQFWPSTCNIPLVRELVHTVALEALATTQYINLRFRVHIRCHYCPKQSTVCDCREMAIISRMLMRTNQWQTVETAEHQCSPLLLLLLGGREVNLSASSSVSLWSVVLQCSGESPTRSHWTPTHNTCVSHSSAQRSCLTDILNYFTSSFTT